jgi:hypothetical protein
LLADVQADQRKAHGVGGDPCAMVFNSWRDWNPENPECLHGYSMFS